MRGLAWLRSDPRGKLVIALAVFLLLSLTLPAAGIDPRGAGLPILVGYVWVVLVPLNALVLRRRKRSLAWLLFHLAGALSLIPIGVALLARPGRAA